MFIPSHPTLAYGLYHYTNASFEIETSNPPLQLAGVYAYGGSAVCYKLNNTNCNAWQNENVGRYFYAKLFSCSLTSVLQTSRDVYPQILSTLLYAI